MIQCASLADTTTAAPPTQPATTQAPTPKPTLVPTPKPTEKPKPILAFDYTLKDANGPCVLLKLGARIEQGKVKHMEQCRGRDSKEKNND